MVSSAAFHDQLILLPPNRVWRSYPGGATLDRFEGKDQPADTHFSEDWIGSVTSAVNPGREDIAEGVSQVQVGDTRHDFRQLITADPTYFLGSAHVEKHGDTPMLLVKFLDSAIRLHFQCHPSNEFARRVLSSPSGKTEAYHILGVREGVIDPHIYVGFQRPPPPALLKAWIETQNIAALESCFDRIPVSAGDTYFIPGSTPHALGEGIFMVEIQEPTDFAIRFEYERAGYVLPEVARFMGRDVDFGISMVDLTAHSMADVQSRFHCTATKRRTLGSTSWQDELIGADRTACFTVKKTHVGEVITKSEDTFSINIVTAGTLAVSLNGRVHRLETYDKFFCPAGISSLDFNPIDGPAEILECFPPQ